MYVCMYVCIELGVFWCLGESTCGQRAVYQLGMTGVPVYNVSEKSVLIHILYIHCTYIISIRNPSPPRAVLRIDAQGSPT